MNGRYVTIQPLSGAHRAGLWSAASGAADPALWKYLPYGPFGSESAFENWLADCLSSEDPRFFAVVPAASNTPSGMLALARDKPQHRVVEIGHVWFGAELQRTTAATEAVALAMAHVFDEMGYRRLEWKCDALNDRSRAAALRFGFTYEGTFRQHMLIDGRNRDSAWFSLLDSEWPEQRMRFERWLDPGNFGPDGGQINPLR